MAFFWGFIHNGINNSVEYFVWQWFHLLDIGFLLHILVVNTLEEHSHLSNCMNCGIMDIHKVLRKLASLMNGLQRAIFHTNMQLEAQLAKQVELEVNLEALFILKPALLSSMETRCNCKHHAHCHLNVHSKQILNNYFSTF